MSFAAVGSLIQTQSTSVSLDPQNVGDLILVQVQTNSTSVWCTGISGGGCTWEQIGEPFSDDVLYGIGTQTTFVGTITATGSGTATLSFNGSTPSIIRLAGHEFSSSVGSWALDGSQGTLANAGGTSTMPSLTPSGTGELYFCFSNDYNSTAVAGSASGYTYELDSLGNGLCFNPDCTSAAQAPTWDDSGEFFGVAVLLCELPVVVQSIAGGQGTASLDFANPVTDGNSVIIIAQGYGSGTTSSNPTYNGVVPLNSTLLAELNPDTYYTYAGVWLMPNLSGGSTTVGITITPGGTNGFTAIEVAGLGSNPGLDPNGGASEGYGADSSTGMPSSDMPALANATALLIGSGAAYGVGTYTTPNGWTDLPNASYSTTQYMVADNATGNQYQYNPSGGSAGWGSLIVAIEPNVGPTSPINYNTGTAASVTNATSVNFTIPNTGGLNSTGVQVGDVMLTTVSVFTEDSTQPTVSFSGGGGTWGLVPMTDGSTNPQLSQSGSIYCYNFAYLRVATEADIGATVTMSESGSPAGTTWLGVAMASYTGANQLNPIDRAGGATDNDTSDAVTCPSEIARIAGDWAVYLCGGGFNYGATPTPPAGAVQRQYSLNSGATGAAIADSNGPTGLTTIGGGSYINNGFGSAYLSAFTVVLAPAGVYVVQTYDSGGWTGNLSSNATPGNTLFMFPVSYAVPANTTSSGPQYDGSSVTGATQLWSTQSQSGSNDMYSTVWMLPNLPSAATSFGVTVSGGFEPSPLCANLLLEVLGLGSNPIADQSVTAFGSSGTSNIGPTGATQYADEIVLASGAIYGAYPSDGPGAPWTDFTDPTNQHAIVSWQTTNASGGTYSWTESGNGSPWAGGIATVTASNTPPSGLYHVQDVYSGKLTSGGTTFTVDISSTLGNLFTLAIEAYTTGNNPVTISSITDSAGNTWDFSTSDSSQSPPAAGSYYGSGNYYGLAAVTYAPDAIALGASGSVTITFSASITDAVYLTVSEFANAPAGIQIDASASQVSDLSGQTSQSTPSIAATGSHDVVVAQTTEGNAWSSVNTPFTLVAGTDCAWAIVTPGSYQATFSGSSNQIVSSVILALGIPSYRSGLLMVGIV